MVRNKQGIILDNKGGCYQALHGQVLPHYSY
uniref:Transcription factor MYB1R1 n=1 Tax=Rhizophora mucronata TaxID=61149 RepID=A0A2P2QNJ8_RHIMU